MSQITIGGSTLNFKDSAFTGDQWEQVASWVLNGSGEAIDKNAEDAIKAAQDAAMSATLSKSYSVGGTGTRTGEDTDNAKYYSEQAAAAAKALENFDGTGLPIVTTADNGKILVVINGEWQLVKVIDDDADTMTAAQLGRAVLNAMRLASEV